MIRGAWIGSERRHDRKREVEQAARVEQHAVGVADAPALIARLREIRVDQPREKPVGPVGVRAFRCVDFLLVAPHPLAVLQHRHFVFRDNLVGNVDDVLGVVEEGDGVVIAADQQDLAIELDEAFERRAVAERVAPRLRREQISGLFPPPRRSARCDR